MVFVRPATLAFPTSTKIETGIDARLQIRNALPLSKKDIRYIKAKTGTSRTCHDHDQSEKESTYATYIDFPKKLSEHIALIFGI